MIDGRILSLNPVHEIEIPTKLFCLKLKVGEITLCEDPAKLLPHLDYADSLPRMCHHSQCVVKQSL